MKFTYICLAFILYFLGCRHYELPQIDNNLISSYDKSKGEIKIKNYDYVPDWNKKQNVKGGYYIPLTSKSTRFSKTLDGTEYSLADKTWLLASQIDEVWKFKVLTVFPDDIKDLKSGGLIIFEDLLTAKSSYINYLDNKYISKNELIEIYASSNNKLAKLNTKTCRKTYTTVCMEGHCVTVMKEICTDEVIDPNLPDFPPFDDIGCDGCSSGGSGGGSGAITSFNILASGPKIDPKKENNCFNTSQPAELTIYVQQAKEGSRDLVGPNEVGHVFVGIKQGGIERYYGFYPESGSNSAMVAVGKNYNSELRDNSGEMHHVSITKNITANQLNSIVSYANNPPQTYNVNIYACTDFGIAVGKLGGINLPSTKATNMVFNGTSPGNLGEDIKSGNFPNTTKNTKKSNAPSKKGSCP